MSKCEDSGSAQCGYTEEAEESMPIPCVCLHDPALRAALRPCVRSLVFPCASRPSKFGLLFLHQHEQLTSILASCTLLLSGLYSPPRSLTITSHYFGNGVWLLCGGSVEH